MDGAVVYTIKWLSEDYSGHYEMLYRAMYRRLFLFARNFLMDEAPSADIVQEVFVGLWTNRKRMRQDILLEPYLFTSVRNKCIDYHRKMHIVDKYQKHLERSGALVCFPYEEEEEDREFRMKQAFSELSDMQRQVLQLSVMEGLKYTEIAENLNIAEGTVHTHVKRAYKNIKKYFSCLILFGLFILKIILW